jgi:glycosyltransferase involved in cell wall biosynthesis
MAFASHYRPRLAVVNNRDQRLSCQHVLPLETQPANDLDHLLILIPAWQPDARLPALVGHLALLGFTAMLVIDDGSSSSFAPIFDQLQQHPSVRVVRHPRNRGKGRALKTGIGVILREMPQIQGIITADADGQHTAADVLQVAHTLRNADDLIVLGTRTLSGSVPLRCRIGNATTRALFCILTRVRLADTQSGLRGLPRSLLQEMLHLEGERYEYEMVMLAHLCRTGRRPIEVPIQTLYLDGNRSSHFHPIRDSVRVLFALCRSALRR